MRIIRTAAQNKAEGSGFIDSIGELVSLCEKEGFIPRYYVDKPQDKVDETLVDLKRYTHTLVTEEVNLGNMIEQAMRQIELDKLNEAQINVDDEEDNIDDSIMNYDVPIDLTVEDYLEYDELLDEEYQEEDE